MPERKWQFPIESSLASVSKADAGAGRRRGGHLSCLNSKFGLGDALGRMTTPLGFLRSPKKWRPRANCAVFHNRRFTGEILAPNAPGRDPITTRIIWLRGSNPQRPRFCSLHLYSRYASGKLHRPACELRLHSHEVERRR